MLGLEWSKVDLRTRTIETEPRMGSNGKARMVVTPISDELRDMPYRLTGT